jgi:uncharacterized integral membrane protein
MLLIVIAVAIFAIQNSAAPLITIKFLIWKIETSLIYTILVSIGLGILLILLFWIPRSIRDSLKRRKLNRETPSTRLRAEEN